MAYATHTQTGPLSLLARIAEIREQAAEAFAAWRIYRSTVNELSALGDRELSDLGIARSQIRALAREAAYGQTN